MARSPVRHMKDSCVFQGFSELLDENTLERVPTWDDVSDCKCLLSKRAETETTGEETQITVGVYRLLVPPDTDVGGVPLDITQHRIGDITLEDGSIEAGPFTINEILRERGYLMRQRYITLALERLRQE